MPGQRPFPAGATRLAAVLALASFSLIMGGASSAHAQSWVLTGSVTDTDGTGIEGVDIDIADGDGVTLSLSGDASDADGDFTITVLEDIPSGFYTVEYNAPVDSGYRDVTEEVFLSGDADLGTTVLTQEWTVSGYVLDESGTGIEGIDLELFDPDGVEVEINNDDTDADGLYSITIEAGTWSLLFRQVTSSSDVLVPVLIENIDVSSDVTLDDVTMLVGFSVTGVVEDEAGDPIAGLDIDVMDALTDAQVVTPGDTTDSAGEFEIFVPEGDFVFEFKPSTGSGLVAQVVEATVSAPPVSNDLGTIVIPVGYVLSGTIVDDTSTAVAGVDLDFHDSSTGIEIPLLDANSATDGTFSVLVEAGTYDIVVRPGFSTGYAPLREPSIEVSDATDVGDLILSDGIAFTGTVTDGTDALEGVAVAPFDPDSGEPVTTFENKTNLTGEYSLRVVAGDYDVLFVPPDVALPTASFPGLDLTADTTLDVALEVPPSVSAMSCEVDTDDVSLSWTNGSTDYDSILLARDGELLATLSATATSYTDVAPGAGTYEYSVVPIRGGVAGLAATCSIDVGSPPEAVTDLSCSVTDQDVALSWTNPESDYDEIVVRRDGVTLATLGGTATSYADDGLTDGSYGYSVQAVRDSATSAFTTCTIDVDAIPEAVEGLLCESTFDDVTLSWTNATTDYDSVDIYRDSTLVDSLAGTAESFEDAGLADGRYDYAVVPVRSSFDGPDSTCSVLLENIPAAVSDLTCTEDGSTITLTWTNGETDYDEISVYRAGALLDTLVGSAASYVDAGLDAGTYEYEVVPGRDGFEASGATCSGTSDGSADGPFFKRGDSNNSGSIDLADAIFDLKYLFLDGTAPSCLAAADFNASDAVDLADAISVLKYLFLSGDAPSSPFPDCGENPSSDISCLDQSSCD